MATPLDPDIFYSPEQLAEPAAALVAKMSLEEAASLCSGRNFWQLKGIPRLGLESVSVADGPHGLRKQENEADHLGLGASMPATCFPTAVTLAATWDVSLLREVGRRIGAEAAARGVSVVLGPGVNIKRSPLCGRNFEYFAEDPHLSGELAVAWIEGVQSQGVGASLKHFVANEQEWQRMVVDTLVDERTLREIYLAAFEPAVHLSPQPPALALSPRPKPKPKPKPRTNQVRRARPWTVMAAYNRLLGVYCCEHEWLLGHVLREEWCFGGLVVSDWLGTSERVRACERGLDLEMPGLNKSRDARLVLAVHEGRLPQQAVRTAATRVASLILAAQHNRRGRGLEGAALAALLADNHAAARRVACQGAVLLKNEGGVLPLRASRSVAVLGAFAERPRYQGAGSSSINASRCETPLAAIRAAVEAAGGSVSYAPGYEPLCAGADAALRDQAVAVARAAESVVRVCGLAFALAPTLALALALKPRPSPCAHSPLPSPLPSPSPSPPCSPSP